MLLTIRAAQMHALNQVLQRNYILRVADLFTQRYPQRFANGTVDAAAFIEARLPVAMDYGINSELHIAMFLNFVLLHGDDFASKPEFDWVVAILSETEGTGNERMERVDSLMRVLSGGRRSNDG
jgi:hypothetical protein